MKSIQPNKAYTPKRIADSWERYQIPIYQRLFAWDHDAVSCLLKDLKKAFDDYTEMGSNTRPYYIGLITSTKQNDLVDGQQRFTVLTFIGLVLSQYYCEWSKFLQVGTESRLSFVARDGDNRYLKSLIEDPLYLGKVLRGEYDPRSKNHQLMQDALVTINETLKDKTAFPDDEYIKCFAKYVYENTSFFISQLPYSSSKALNTYFEAMNSTGRNLENHEILKVNLLNEISSQDEQTKHCYALIWNAVADMDTPIIRKRHGEETCDFINRFNRAMIATMNPSSLNVKALFSSEQGYSDINHFYSQALTKEDPVDGDTIANIKESKEEPGKVRYESSTYRSMLRFTEFLLHVLFLDSKNTDSTISDTEIIKRDFFEPNNLSDTFKRYRKNMSAEYFISSLLKYRILYDYFVVRISSSGDKYLLYMRGEEDAQVNEDTKELKRRVSQFESFQYVFSSKKTYYKWLCPLLEFVSANPTEIKFEDLLCQLKEIDNREHDIVLLNNPDNFRYDNGVDRYWFWRIDYYLWQNRKEEFAQGKYEICSHFKIDKVLACVDKYTFKRNRSIEHVAAQHPVMEEGQPAEPYKNLHDFGNLVMISSGLNSSLKNTSYEVKRGHIETYMKETFGIESLSMLQIYYADRDWTDDDIKNRTQEMLTFLKRTYQM